MEDEDYLLALQLQEEYDKERDAVIPEDTPLPGTSTSLGAPSGAPSSSISLADPSWELIDPNPDIRILFLQYNDRFFWGRLAGVEVRWSPRMTLCAGLCVYEGRGGLCSVRLSLPLLKLRPRKDLVETLLHEMIHAYLFVTDNNKDHDGHGPEFHKHMYRINKDAGVNITVYHSFHDEVAEYKKHWWRCNGPCQHRKPFYGYVKRAMNRAPGPNDNWWKDHQNSCNGVFIKIKEPEDYGKKKKKEKDATNKESKDGKSNTQNSPGKSKNMDIRVFVGKGNILGRPSGTEPDKTSSENADKKIPQDKNTATKFYDSDSDDCISLDTPGNSNRSSSDKNKQQKVERPLDKFFTSRRRSSDTEVQKEKTENRVEDTETESNSFDVLSESDEELLSEVEKIFKSNDKDEVEERKSVEVHKDQDVKLSPKLTDTSLRNSQNSSHSTSSSGKSSDVQLKLRSVWGSKFTSSNSSKSSLSRIDINRKIDSDNTKLTLKTSTGQKRLNNDDDIDKGERKRLKPDDNSDSSAEHSRIPQVIIPDAGVGPLSSSNSIHIVDQCVCPVCSKSVPAHTVNEHLDHCLGVT